MYDPTGKFIGYMMNTGSIPTIPGTAASVPLPPTESLPQTSSSVQTTLSIAPPFVPGSVVNTSAPSLQANSNEKKANTKAEHVRGKELHQTLNDLGVDKWDGWPDGNLSLNFTWDEVKETKKLMEHWAHTVSGGLGGEDMARTWEEGKKALR
ncbi:hypothetical protein DXG01_015839, partial [Tephrocybe rancida]